MKANTYVSSICDTVRMSNNESICQLAFHWHATLLQKYIYWVIGYIILIFIYSDF